MADFSLTTLFVVPVAQTALPSAISTQDLTAGQLGIFDNTYLATATPQNFPYFYIAQGRANTYLQGSKRSDKIKGCLAGTPCNSNVTEWYKSTGCPTASNQIIDISGFDVHCGEIVSLTLRAHSNMIDALDFNGLTRSVTVNAPCCDCDESPCTNVDVDALIDSLIAKLEQHAPGINPDNLKLTDLFTFGRVGSGVNAVLRIEGKPLTKYGLPCDITAFPFEYDRMHFRAFVIEGPDTSADFIVSDACHIVATSTIVQTANYPTGQSEEIAQLEKNFYSYQAGYLKHLYSLAGYNQNFESFVAADQTYSLFYIKFNQLDRSADNWGDNIPQDSMVIIAVLAGGAMETALENVLELALGPVASDDTCITTTTTTAAPSTTTTTTTEEIIG